MKNKVNAPDQIKKSWLIIISIILISVIGIDAYTQVIRSFTQRASAANPAKLIYNIKGDYTMIGNTNLTLVNYGDNINNSNNDMKYVDVDSDPNTLNSSSATLTFSTENGAIPSCSHIIYAGMYWTGRASNASSSPGTFSVTKGSVTKQYDKRTIQVKGPGQSTYTQFVANSGDIYFPSNTDEFMYSAYIEVTDYVKACGIGQYTVADIALIEGNGGSTGYYGGWGMIVVYENSKMKWRDITIFDGHAYVMGNMSVHYELPVAGFHTVQNGPVNLKLGLMAGEGDIGISGDYFKIRNYADNAWVSLSHSGNSSNNFFNSSVNTGGNLRNPNLQNNMGLDIVMFNIPNTGNSVVTNNQTSTKFQYGSTQDTYIIFFIAMSVDAYVPEIEFFAATLTINGLPVGSGPLTVQPGQDIEYKFQVKNLGTEAINNTKFIIPIPFFTSYVVGSGIKTINFTPPPSPNNFYFDPMLGPNGSIVWDFGTLPLPPVGLPDSVLAVLTFHLKVIDDCIVLKDPDFHPDVTLSNGAVSGIGAISGTSFSNIPFIQGYQISGGCKGEPITDPLRITIDTAAYFAENCIPLPVTLLSFTGEKGKDGIRLDWATATETNCDYFLVEKSLDGINFCRVENRSCSRYSTVEIKYFIIDYKASEGVNYYRLVQTDFNGKTNQVGKMVAVNYCTNSTPLHIFPNPNDGSSFFIHVNNVPDEKIVVMVNDEIGREIFSKYIPNEKYDTIEVSDFEKKLSPGIYVITATCEKGLCQQKIIIK